VHRPRGDRAGSPLPPRLQRSAVRMRVGVRVGVRGERLRLGVRRPDEHVVDDVEQSLHPLLRGLEHTFDSTKRLGRNVCSERNPAAGLRRTRRPGPQETSEPSRQPGHNRPRGCPPGVRGRLSPAGGHKSPRSRRTTTRVVLCPRTRTCSAASSRTCSAASSRTCSAASSRRGRRDAPRGDRDVQHRGPREVAARGQEPSEDQTSSLVAIRSTTAPVNSVVPACPPRSGVFIPAATVSSVPS
jgi:hypothetical protein